MHIPKGKKIYFASDFHLGSPNLVQSHAREKTILNWIDSVEQDMLELHLVGDVFDFWFEYKHVVPKGYVRLLGKLAELSDKGIPIHLYTGNHDMWMFGYLKEEIKAHIHTKDQIYTWNKTKVWVGHGDGLGQEIISINS
jgi:UDP-2,3-diacylglucosamine hydrolase